MSAKTQANRQQLTEREKLARDLYIRLCESPGVMGKDSAFIAEKAIERADAFFDILESRKE
jgi:hypothetical protein